MWAANFGALEWHAWTSRVEHPHQPTYALIDLDPGEASSWEDVLVLARLHRTAFEHLGVCARPKLTGRRGIQIWVPLTPGPDFAATRAWVEQLSRSVGAVVPELVSWKWQKDERAGRARLDYTQNAINKTLVAPYSPRACAGATVSAPIDWDELDDPDLRPDTFTIHTIGDRIAAHGDLFRDVLDGAWRAATASPRITTLNRTATSAPNACWPPGTGAHRVDGSAVRVAAAETPALVRCTCNSVYAQRGPSRAGRRLESAPVRLAAAQDVAVFPTGQRVALGHDEQHQS